MIFAQYNVFGKISDILPKNKIVAYIISFIIFGLLIALYYYFAKEVSHKKQWEMIYAVFPTAVICFFSMKKIENRIIK